MERKELYYYNENKIHNVKGFIKINMRSGMNLVDDAEKELIKQKLTEYCLRSKIYPLQLLILEDKELENELKFKNIVFFERKEICEVLKDNNVGKHLINPDNFISSIYELINKTISLENDIVCNLPKFTKSLEIISKTYTQKFSSCCESVPLETLGIMDKLDSLKMLIFYIMDDVYNDNESIYDNCYHLLNEILLDKEDENHNKKSILVYVQDLKNLWELFKIASQSVIYKEALAKQNEDKKVMCKENNHYEIDINNVSTFIENELKELIPS